MSSVLTAHAGVIDMVRQAASCVPYPQCARPRDPLPGWMPAPGSELRGSHGSSQWPPLNFRSPLQIWSSSHLSASQGGAWAVPGNGSQLLLPATQGGGQAWCPHHSGAMAVRVRF